MFFSLSGNKEVLIKEKRRERTEDLSDMYGYAAVVAGATAQIGGLSGPAKLAWPEPSDSDNVTCAASVCR